MAWGAWHPVSHGFGSARVTDSINDHFLRKKSHKKIKGLPHKQRNHNGYLQIHETFRNITQISLTKPPDFGKIMTCNRVFSSRKSFDQTFRRRMSDGDAVAKIKLKLLTNQAVLLSHLQSRQSWCLPKKYGERSVGFGNGGRRCWKSFEETFRHLAPHCLCLFDDEGLPTIFETPLAKQPTGYERRQQPFLYKWKILKRFYSSQPLSWFLKLQSDLEQGKVSSSSLKGWEKIDTRIDNKRNARWSHGGTFCPKKNQHF